MNSNYRKIEKDKIIKVNIDNKYKKIRNRDYNNRNNNNYNSNSQNTVTYTFNMLNNGKTNININLNKKENIDEYTSKKKLIDIPTHFKSQSLIEDHELFEYKKKNENLVKNIRFNKYLVPMIEKKKIEKKVYRLKFKEAPSNITDFLSKIRQSNERNITESNEKYNKVKLYRNNYSFDNLNNINNYNNIDESYKLNSKTYINDINYYMINANEDIYFQKIKDNNLIQKNYKKIYQPKKIQNQQEEYLYNNKIKKINNRHYRYDSSFINNNVNDNIDQNNNYEYINSYEERIIYPIVYNYKKGFKNKYYLNKIYTPRNKKDILNYENYLQNKKLFIVYRGKLFKLLYTALSKFFNICFMQLKNYAFQKLKEFRIKNKIYKDKILQRIYPKQRAKSINKKNENKIPNINNDEYSKISTYYNSNMNSSIKNKKNDNSFLNNSMNTSRSFAHIIKTKNENDSKRRDDSTELCKNISELKEKYEQIQKRKNIKNNEKSPNNRELPIMYTKNKLLFNKNLNSSKCIYKRKKLYNVNKDKDKEKDNNNSNFKNENFSTDNLNTNLNKVNNGLKGITYYKKKTNNNGDNQKIKNENKYPNKEKNEKNSITKRLDKIYNNELKEPYNSKNILIKKIIKNIKSPDKRLFVSIKYVYLPNEDIKGRKEKYNDNILESINTDNFSIYKKLIYNISLNKDRLIGIIEEEESSNFNCTFDSNNSFDYKINKRIRNKNSRNNNNYSRSSSINDKYLFSCVNFITKAIKRVILKNSYNFFKKRINLEK